ncbi:MAG: hypothetical protein ACOCXX_01440, partial [Planctomycetota bacterium]
RLGLIADPLYRPFGKRPPATLAARFDHALAEDSRPTVLNRGDTAQLHLTLGYPAGPGEAVEKISWWLDSSDPRVVSIERKRGHIDRLEPGATVRVVSQAVTLAAEVNQPLPPGTSPDEVLLTVNLRDGAQRSWTVPLRVPLGARPLVDKPSPVRLPAAAPDGRLLACVAGGAVQLVDRQTGAARTVLEADPARRVHHLAFSPGGSRLAVYCSRRPEGAPPQAPDRLCRLPGAFDPSAVHPTSVVVVDVVSGEAVASPTLREVRWLGLSDAGHVYYQGPRTLARFEPEVNRQFHFFRVTPDTTLVPSPDFSKLLCYRPDPPRGENPLVVRDLRGRILKQYRGFNRRTMGLVPEMTWSGDGRRFAVSQASGRIDVIDLETGPVEGLVTEGQHARLSPGGTRLAWSLLRHDAYRLSPDGKKARHLGTRRTAEGRVIESYYPSPGRRWVAVHGLRGLVLRRGTPWAEDHKVVAAVAPGETVSVVAWSWDERRLFFRIEGQRPSNYLYDLDTGRLQLDIAVDPLNSATWSDDSRRLYLSTPAAVLTYDPSTSTFTEKTLKLVDRTPVVISPTREYLLRITPGAEDTSRLALAEPGTQWFVDFSTLGAVRRAAFSKDGRRLLVEDTLGTVGLWSLPDPGRWKTFMADNPAAMLKHRQLTDRGRSSWIEADGSVGWMVPRQELHLAGIEEGATDTTVLAGQLGYRWLPGDRSLGIVARDEEAVSIRRWTLGQLPHALTDDARSGPFVDEAAFTGEGAVVPDCRRGGVQLWWVGPQKPGRNR